MEEKKSVNYCIEKPQQKIPWLKIVRRWESINIDTFPTLALLQVFAYGHYG